MNYWSILKESDFELISRSALIATFPLAKSVLLGEVIEVISTTSESKCRQNGFPLISHDHDEHGLVLQK